MNIFVAGGAGYIGSHTCVALLQAGHSVVVADNFTNSSCESLAAVRLITGRELSFYEVDVTDAVAVETIFHRHRFDGVIHFAGFKAVGESVENPLAYYRNNVLSTVVLAEACRRQGVSRFVFSSSATVYGDNQSPLLETLPLLPTTNPYGETKVISERILTDVTKTDSSFSVALLRYFNPVGAHESGLLGEKPKGTPNNLMPYIVQVAKRQRDCLPVFGGDYPTVDGTGVRDYIHVMDLAEGHIAALSIIKSGVHVYNLGTGKGTSVLQLVKTFEAVTGARVTYEVVGRRPGDLAECYASVGKAKRELAWTAKRDLADMCRDSWRAELLNLSGG